MSFQALPTSKRAQCSNITWEDVCQLEFLWSKHEVRIFRRFFWQHPFSFSERRIKEVGSVGKEVLMVTGSFCCGPFKHERTQQALLSSVCTFLRSLQQSVYIQDTGLRRGSRSQTSNRKLNFGTTAPLRLTFSANNPHWKGAWGFLNLSTLRDCDWPLKELPLCPGLWAWTAVVVATPAGVSRIAILHAEFWFQNNFEN